MDYYRKELRQIKNQVRDLIDPYYLEENSCKFCWERSSFKMTVHHRSYIKDDVIYKNYPNTIQGRIEYYSELLPLVRDQPERFLYVCISCHNKLEYYLQFGQRLELEIIKELNKKWSNFQYLNTSHPFIAKYVLRELNLDVDKKLHKKIDDRPNKPTEREMAWKWLVKKYPTTPPTMSGLEDFFK